jgi:hypothetical protein
MRNTGEFVLHAHKMVHTFNTNCFPVEFWSNGFWVVANASLSFSKGENFTDNPLYLGWMRNGDIFRTSRPKIKIRLPQATPLGSGPVMRGCKIHCPDHALHVLFFK